MVAFQAILVSFSNKVHCQYWHLYQCFGKNWCLGFGGFGGFKNLSDLGVDVHKFRVFQAEVTVALPLFPYRKII